jgi:hypothetical protein
MDGDQKTNNLVEGFNHGFSLSLPAHAMDWSVIERFKVEEAMTKVALHQAAMGNTGQSHNTSMNRKRQDREDKLEVLWATSTTCQSSPTVHKVYLFIL